MRLPAPNRHVPPRQRGVFGLMAVGVMFLLIICVVVALDSGRLYLQKQNVQRVADMAALDAVAGLSFSGEDVSGDPQVIAEQNAALNNFAPEEGERTIDTAMGAIEVVDGINRFNDEESGSALRVRAWHRVPTSLVGNLARLMPNADIEPHVWLMGEAVAQQREFVAFTASSSLLTADLSDSELLGPVLQGLLGSEVDIDVVSAGGLANLGVSLLGLIETDPDIGTMDQLLSTPISIGGENGLANLMLQALRNDAEDGEILRVTEDALGELAKVSLDPIELGDILTINTPDSSRDSALETLISVGDLLNAGIFLANKESAVSVPTVSVDTESLLGAELLQVDVGLNIIEPPQLAIGPPGCTTGGRPPCDTPGANDSYWATQVSTAQLDLDVDLSLRLLGLLTLSVGLDVSAAPGVVGVEQIQALGGEAFDVEVAGRSGLASLDTDISLELLDLDDFSLLKLEIGGATHSSGEVAGVNMGNEVIEWPGSDEHPPSATLKPATTESVAALLDGVLSNLDVRVVLGPDAEDETKDCHWLDLECHASNLISSLFDSLSPVFDVVNDLVDFTVDNLLGLTDALGDVLGGLVGSVLGPILDPLLSALGIGTSEVDVEIIEVGTEGAELVL